MGKSTLDTRRGVRQYTLATGEHRSGSRIFWLPGSDARAYTAWARRMSAGKNILVANRSRCQYEGRPVLPVLVGHFSRAHPVILRKCRRGSGRSLTVSALPPSAHDD